MHVYRLLLKMPLELCAFTQTHMYACLNVKCVLFVLFETTYTHTHALAAPKKRARALRTYSCAARAAKIMILDPFLFRNWIKLVLLKCRCFILFYSFLWWCVPLHAQAHENYIQNLSLCALIGIATCACSKHIH